MEATEFRYGNFIQYKGKIVKVCIIADYTLHARCADNSKIATTFNSGNLSGIILTEERLFKFGFEKDDVKGFYTIDGWFKVSLYGDVELQSGDMYEYHSVSAQSSYVHQLQNLYFALTQKELSLKDENTL